MIFLIQNFEKNIHLDFQLKSKWFPRKDIHRGLISASESIPHGVPRQLFIEKGNIHQFASICVQNLKPSSPFGTFFRILDPRIQIFCGLDYVWHCVHNKGDMTFSNAQFYANILINDKRYFGEFKV